MPASSVNRHWLHSKPVFSASIVTALLFASPVEAIKTSTNYRVLNDGLIQGAGTTSGTGNTVFAIVGEPVAHGASSLNYKLESGLVAIESAFDTDGDKLPDYHEVANGLDPTNPADGNTDTDDDGLTRGEEFQAGSDPGDSDTDDDGVEDGDEVAAGTLAYHPDSDGDGIGDARDNDPTIASNQCGSDPMILASLNVSSGEILQCAAETSIAVQSTVTIQSGGHLELISPTVSLESNLSIPTGGELSIDASDPTPP
ncbi:hypothetical protein ACFL1S_05015 [Pseudomonadota bacterium]